jgi:photosystem II stability/assembly factor-like uncharacterized protein
MKKITSALAFCFLAGCPTAYEMNSATPDVVLELNSNPPEEKESPSIFVGVPISTTLGLTNPLYGVWGNASGVDFVVGTNGTVLRSQKGEPFTGTSLYPGIGFTDIWGDGDIAFVSGWYGYMMRTGNGGESWERLSINSTESFLGIWGSSVNDVYAAGSGGVIVHTTDQGKTWNTNVLPEAGMFYAMWGSGAKDVYAVGNGGYIAHSKDGGKSWIGQTKDPELGFAFTYFVGVWGSSSKDVYVVGHEGYLLHSTDEGQTWMQQKLPDFQPLGVWGTSADNVYIFGEAGKLMHSTDHGKTWESVITGSTSYICGFWGRDANSIIMAGDNGLLSRLVQVK